ncbi:hypothetical protein QVD17_29294 [Tagetes erecta]|uniref:Uncharacterized protein n=1 Tax=Tagetes erecta TaxID=13708 RepID=A0AAD8KHT8_TARER|nr:hypothetical protein QVD17_29294 [Tagetes erecta]
MDHQMPDWFSFYKESLSCFESELLFHGRIVDKLLGSVDTSKVNSQRISNVCIDALSAEKPYYFIRLMGRKASHVAVEGKLQLHPNMVIYVEKVDASKLTILT